MLPYSE